MGYAPASASDAMDMVQAGLSYLAAADAAQLPAQTQAETLRGLERTDAISTAARAWFLAAFTAGQGYAGDAEYSVRAWLMHRTGITRGAAAGHTAWPARAETHPKVVAARELRGKDITVNAVAPGPTATPLFLDGKDQQTIDNLAKAAPLERLGTPADIAEAVAFLAGPARRVNGQIVYVNGGLA
jgi:3-oxoacyl-[acyl-carrier protein] reductase